MRLHVNSHMIGLALVAAVVAAAGAETETEGRSLKSEVRSAPATRSGSRVEKLYLSKCAKCHKFYDPAKYSDDEWERWMGKMGRKSKLNPEQQKELSQYIQGKYRSGTRSTGDAANTRRLAPDKPRS